MVATIRARAGGGDASRDQVLDGSGVGAVTSEMLGGAGKPKDKRA